MGRTVAEEIVNMLVKCGVERIYGIPGDSIDPLMDALRRNQKIQYVQARHEEGAALEAAFEAKVTGLPVACMGTSGPGSIHLLNGLYEAKMDHVPVIALTGQVETDLIGSDYFQEINVNRLFEDVSVYSQQINNPENAAYLTWRAFLEAKNRRGVSHLTLPVDILRMDVKNDFNYYFVNDLKPVYSVIPETAQNMINQSSHPLIFIGRGSVGLGDRIVEFAERIGSPIIYALNAKGIVADSDKRVLGGLGLLGSKPSVVAMEKCDLIIFLGTSYPYKAFINSEVKTIQVDLNPENIGKRFHVSVPYVSSVLDFLNAVKPEEKTDKFYLQFQTLKKEWTENLEKGEQSESRPIRPERVVATLSRKVTDDAIIVVDTGNVTVWGMRNFRTSVPRTFLFSPWLGSMGVGIPGSIGASFGSDKPVVALVGDGSFAMTMMELITARKYNRPVKIIVFNNSKLGMIKFEQEVMGYPEWGVDLLNPDFSKIAEAVGIIGIRVEDPLKLEDSMSRFLSAEGPAVLDVVVDPDARPMPPELTFKEIKGYITSMFREKLGTI
ncbi:MAG: thiamine pyrophosphate-dependent enzyme [Thermoplasmata archaeon]